MITHEQAWLYGILSGLGLSLLGFVAAALIVSIRKCVSQSAFAIITSLIYALGCGAIIGDAVFELLPDAYTSKQTNKHIVSAIFVAAILFFLILERTSQNFGITHEHWVHTEHGEDVQYDNFQDHLTQIKHQNQQNDCLQSWKGKHSAGYLNIISSFVHNFCDGFAVGVAFASRQPKVYTPLLIAIFAHQIPREIGDVGILMKSGFTGIQTILCNGFVNVMSLVGVIVGLSLSAIGEATNNYIMAFVAGNFIYIGADIWQHLLRNKFFCHNIVEIQMFVLGLLAMLLAVHLQEDGQQ